VDHNKRPQEQTATDPATEASPSPAVPEPVRQQFPVEAVEAASAVGAAKVAPTAEPGNMAAAPSVAMTAAAPPPSLPQPSPVPPRVRARWAHAGTGAGESSTNASNGGAPTPPAVSVDEIFSEKECLVCLYRSEILPKSP